MPGEGTRAAAIRLAVVRVRQDREFYYASVVQAQSLIQQGGIREAREVLLNCPEAHRHWEWGHLMALCHQEALTIPDFTNILFPALTSVGEEKVAKVLCFDRSSQRLGALGLNGVWKVHEVSSGQLVWTRGDPTNQVDSVVFHSSEDRVAGQPWHPPGRGHGDRPDQPDFPRRGYSHRLQSGWPDGGGGE